MHSDSLLSLATALELDGADLLKRRLIADRLRYLAADLAAAEAVAVPPHLRAPLPDDIPGVAVLAEYRRRARA